MRQHLPSHARGLFRDSLGDKTSVFPLDEPQQSSHCWGFALSSELFLTQETSLHFFVRPSRISERLEIRLENAPIPCPRMCGRMKENGTVKGMFPG